MLSSPLVLQQVPWTVDDYTFHSDFWVLSLTTFHAVDSLWDSFSSEDSLVNYSLGSASPEYLFLAISMSAMACALAAHIVCLQGHLLDIPVELLIDSGSSSSFINESLVPLLHNIQTFPVSSSVQVARGGMLSVQKVTN